MGTEAHWTEDTPLVVNYLGYLGLETQAIAGLTVHRMAPTPDFFNHMPEYVALFDAAFPDVQEDNRYSVEMAGLAIAAYERDHHGIRIPLSTVVERGAFGHDDPPEGRGHGVLRRG